MAKQAKRVELIPIDRITILNPRNRNGRQHADITESIRLVGLKRPITVSKHPGEDGAPRYNLVCGQGRIEAFQKLDQVEIPAFVIEAPEEECLLKSLVENVARRQHTPLELMQEIGSLHQRGYTNAQIAGKVGVTASWVGDIVFLLEKGEERLVKSVETGLLKVSLAVELARCSDSETQQVLADAYAKGILRGKKLAVVRRLLLLRSKSAKASAPSTKRKHTASRKISAEQLRKVYQQEADRQRLMVNKASIVEMRLTFVVQVFRKLLAEGPEFTSLLKEEGMEAIPQQLHARIA